MKHCNTAEIMKKMNDDGGDDDGGDDDDDDNDDDNDDDDDDDDDNNGDVDDDVAVLRGGDVKSDNEVSGAMDGDREGEDDRGEEKAYEAADERRRRRRRRRRTVGDGDKDDESDEGIEGDGEIKGIGKCHRDGEGKDDGDGDGDKEIKGEINCEINCEIKDDIKCKIEGDDEDDIGDDDDDDDDDDDSDDETDVKGGKRTDDGSGNGENTEVGDPDDGLDHDGDDNDDDDDDDNDDDDDGDEDDETEMITMTTKAVRKNTSDGCKGNETVEEEEEEEEKKKKKKKKQEEKRQQQEEKKQQEEEECKKKQKGANGEKDKVRKRAAARTKPPLKIDESRKFWDESFDDDGYGGGGGGCRNDGDEFCGSKSSSQARKNRLECGQKGKKRNDERDRDGGDHNDDDDDDYFHGDLVTYVEESVAGADAARSAAAAAAAAFDDGDDNFESNVPFNALFDDDPSPSLRSLYDARSKASRGHDAALTLLAEARRLQNEAENKLRAESVLDASADCGLRRATRKARLQELRHPCRFNNMIKKLENYFRERGGRASAIGFWDLKIPHMPRRGEGMGGMDEEGSAIRRRYVKRMWELSNFAQDLHRQHLRGKIQKYPHIVSSLERIGFQWDDIDCMLERMKEYKIRHGNFRSAKKDDFAIYRFIRYMIKKCRERNQERGGGDRDEEGARVSGGGGDDDAVLDERLERFCEIMGYNPRWYMVRFEENVAKVREHRSRMGHCHHMDKSVREWLYLYKKAYWKWTRETGKDPSRMPRPLTEERLEALEAIGFCWGPCQCPKLPKSEAQAQFEENVAKLREHRYRSGNCHDLNWCVWQWLHPYQMAYQSWIREGGKDPSKIPKPLSEERLKALDEIGICWSSCQCTSLPKKRSHKMEAAEKEEDGAGGDAAPLKSPRRRRRRRGEKMTKKEKNNIVWERRFARIRKYKAEHGHLDLIPIEDKNCHGLYSLFRKLMNCYSLFKINKSSDAKFSRLFQFDNEKAAEMADILDEDQVFNHHLSMLRMYREEKGRCPLTSWTGSVRTCFKRMMKGQPPLSGNVTLDADKVAKLTEAGFCWKKCTCQAARGKGGCASESLQARPDAAAVVVNDAAQDWEGGRRLPAAPAIADRTLPPALTGKSSLKRAREGLEGEGKYTEDKGDVQGDDAKKKKKKKNKRARLELEEAARAIMEGMKEKFVSQTVTFGGI